jgi:hypothetical protein
LLAVHATPGPEQAIQPSQYPPHALAGRHAVKAGQTPSPGSVHICPVVSGSARLGSSVPPHPPPVDELLELLELLVEVCPLELEELEELDVLPPPPPPLDEALLAELLVLPPTFPELVLPVSPAPPPPDPARWKPSNGTEHDATPAAVSATTDATRSVERAGSETGRW